MVYEERAVFVGQAALPRTPELSAKLGGFP